QDVVVRTAHAALRRDGFGNENRTRVYRGDLPVSRSPFARFASLRVRQSDRGWKRYVANLYVRLTEILVPDIYRVLRERESASRQKAPVLLPFFGDILFPASPRDQCSFPSLGNDHPPAGRGTDRHARRARFARRIPDSAARGARTPCRRSDP